MSSKPDSVVERIEYHRFNGTNTVACALILNNGFVVVGLAHCLNGAEFDPKLGMQYSREDADRKVCELLAFNQKQQQLNALEGAQV